jgi:hypothetical protein
VTSVSRFRMLVRAVGGSPITRPDVLIDGLCGAAEIIGQRKNAMNLGLDTQDLLRSLWCGRMRDSARLRERRWQAE